MGEEFFMNVPPVFTCFAGRAEVDAQIFPIGLEFWDLLVIYFLLP